MKKEPQIYITPIQLKMPVEIERLIEVSDPVYTFNEVMAHIDLQKYFAEKERRTGGPRYAQVKLLKVILFAFMEQGYVSTRQIEKLCKTDIRFLWLLDGDKAPSHMTIGNFMNSSLNCSIAEIFQDINAYIFAVEDVDLNHVYIDGTKIIANANRYSWVWKKSCTTNRKKVFAKVSAILDEMNSSGLALHGVQFGTREEYAVEYLEMLLVEYVRLMGLNHEQLKYGRGHRKSVQQRLYEKLHECIERLKKYARHIQICGDDRNSYSKTDTGATFMRVKRDYMGNDQLLPAYNMQMAVCDQYIAAYDVRQYASDMDCFQPLMNEFYKRYGFYPEYPVADAGYGSLNNYLFCEERGMKKYMKFTLYKKECEDRRYRDDPYRAVNFRIDSGGDMICPNGRSFHYLYSRPVKGNQYGRTEELYQCEDCNGCPHRQSCFKGAGDRIVRVNRELTQFHREVVENLNCIHGALLRVNRSIQAEGAYGSIKWNRSYTRARRRGLNSLLLETALISCGFNLHKYHLKKQAALAAA